MADSTPLSPEQLKALSTPASMPCWRDKRANGEPVRCGNFHSWEDFIKEDGEKFCKRMCPKKPGGRRKRASGDRQKAVRSYQKQKQYDSIMADKDTIGIIRMPPRPKKVANQEWSNYIKSTAKYGFDVAVKLGLTKSIK